MVTLARSKRLSISLPAETYARLLACQKQMELRTGLPYLSVSNVAALAIEHGIQRIGENGCTINEHS